MKRKRSPDAPGPRGRAAQERRRANSNGLLYTILALVAIAGVALVVVAALSRGGTSPPTSQPGAVVSTIPLDSLPARGQPGAPVTVVEFGDFQCPACAYFATQLEPALAKDYIDTGKVRLVFHDFPLSQHRNALPAAEAARCANDQGAFWQMHDLLYARQSEWADSAQPNPAFAGYAEQIKLDRGAFAQCLSGHTHRADIQAAQQAATKAGVSSTPTFTIDGKPYDASKLRAAIDTALASKQ